MLHLKKSFQLTFKRDESLNERRYHAYPWGSVTVCLSGTYIVLVPHNRCHQRYLGKEGSWSSWAQKTMRGSSWSSQLGRQKAMVRLFDKASPLKSGWCWNIWSRDASSTLGRNDLDMKGQSHRASEGNFTVGSAQKHIYRSILHYITWVGITLRNVSETCVQLNRWVGPCGPKLNSRAAAIVFTMAIEMRCGQWLADYNKSRHEVIPLSNCDVWSMCS